MTFWLCLAVSVVLFWSLPGRWRFGFVGLISFAYLFSLDGSLFSANGQFDSAALLTKNRQTLLHLIVWTGVFYVVCNNLSRFGRWRPYAVPSLVIGILCYLAYFKYVPTLLGYVAGKPLDKHILIPLGISYFSFKFIHYAIECSRGNIKAHSLSQFFAYIYLFPIFTAGPIERFDHFQNQQHRQLRRDDVILGSTRIVHGLIKKFVVAGVLLTSLQPFGTEQLLNNLDQLHFWDVWWFLVLSYLIIYMDFSAYSDIAIGASRLFGFTIMENFNWPVLAPNISNFWKRWHMTLANWCQAYVYMPTLGLTRQPYAAVFMTFLAIGLWHAGSLNFIAWGLYHGLGVSAYFAWNKVKRKKRWFFLERGKFKYWGVPVTFLYMAGSFAFTMTHQTGHPSEFYAALRILCAAFGVTLEA
ncbi:hypothetical protein LJ739_01325 [Aestuariibacter halophilus]|uniref:Probable alginate O-acetylase n=2 Tax=Fluctibacter halophilus TaxID=226011 RepID=A0ABS8G2X1_9ALTE|nr:hypothetical protein [Aestuariibacter halophilus]